MTLVKSLVFIAAVFLSALLIAFLGIDDGFEAIDVPLHFLGGFGWSMLAIVILRKYQQAFVSKWFYLTFCVGFVLIIGTGWEVAEYLLELAVGDHEMLTRLTVRDTLADLLNDSLGAITAWVIFKKSA